MKTGIFCTGRCIESDNWEKHQWIDEENSLLGEYAKTILLAEKEKPESIVFGNGIITRDQVENLNEYTTEYIFDHFNELKDLPQFEGIDLNELSNFIKKISLTAGLVKNTYEEMELAARVFDKKSLEKTIVVSNPDNIARCMQIGHQLYQKTRLKPLKNLFYAQSEIGYNGTTSLTSAIIEMPHRHDDLSPKGLPEDIKKYFSLPLRKKGEFAELVKNYFKNNSL